jgi:hypothetical protein
MKARQLVESASLGPEALKVAYQAFDDAWASIAANYGTDALAIEAARLKLANAILSLIDETTRDPVALKNAALEKIALSYRPGSRANPAAAEPMRKKGEG